MNKNKVFLYAFIILVIIKVGLIFPNRQAVKNMMDMAERFENIKNGVDGFRTFDDSLAGNENFKRRLLDTISKVTELRQVRENQKDKLTNEIEEFTTLYPDREKVIMKYKLLDGLSNLLDVVFVCMAIPIIIYLFKRR